MPQILITNVDGPVSDFKEDRNENLDRAREAFVVEPKWFQEETIRHLMKTTFNTHWCLIKHSCYPKSSVTGHKYVTGRRGSGASEAESQLEVVGASNPDN